MMKIDDFLEFLGLDKEIGGKYLKECLNIIKKKDLKPRQINLSINILPEVAKKCNASFTAVESACRRALKRSFKGNEDEYYDLFKVKSYMTLLQFLKKSRRFIVNSSTKKTKKK